MSRHCPVCWRRAERTTQDNIGAHYDGGGRLCPASAQPFLITVAGKRLHQLKETA